jgi:5-methylcytosine-specific restriction enzyme subunit McrC
VADLELTELAPPSVVTVDDDAATALTTAGVLSGHRVAPGLWEVAPGTKVGVARVGEVTVWIRPKVPIETILFLMGYARRPGWRTDDVDLTAVEDLLPALAEAFVAQAEVAVEQGLLQGYVEVDDELMVLRGRLRDQDQLRRRFGIAVPLLVRYDDHTADIAENRVLRAATDLLLSLPGVAPKVRARLRGLRQILAEVGVLHRGARLPVWQPTRLNQRYHVALWLAELLLAGNALDQAPGSVRVSGFLVDMAKVFEDFLTATMTRALEARGGTCRAQDPHDLDISGRVRMNPDLVWYRGGRPAAVIDAKYKAEKPAGFPNADVYQLLAYCISLDLSAGHLVYAKGNEPTVTHEIRNTGITIHTHTLNLAAAPDALLGQGDDLAGRLTLVVPKPALHPQGVGRVDGEADPWPVSPAG